MFDQPATGYRRLGRNGTGLSRNVTFFGILVVLMLVVSGFYLYISASNDATALRAELRQQSDYTSKLKSELLQANAQLDEAKSGQSTCAELKTNLNEQLEQCNMNVKSARADADSIKNDKETLTNKLNTLKANNSELQAAMNAQKANMSALATVGVGQESVMVKMNETIDALRRDLILKDEIIRKLESSTAASKLAEPVTPTHSSSSPRNAVAGVVDDGADGVDTGAGEGEPLAKVAAPPPPLAPAVVAFTTTQSPLLAAAVDDHADVLSVVDQAQPGDRVKLEDAKQREGGLLDPIANNQQDDLASELEMPPPAAALGDEKTIDI